MSKWLVSVSIAMVLTAGMAQAAGDAEAGKAKTVTCAGCHMPDGNSVNPIWPKLAGQHESVLIKQLQDFKSKARVDATMNAMVMSLNEQDIANVAAYYSAQTQTTGTVAADAVAVGEKIFRGGNTETNTAACMACHSPDGSGNPGAGYPRISGQHAAYVEKALKDFRSGARDNDLNHMMGDVTSRMTDKEIKAVAQYVQGLK